MKKILVIILVLLSLLSCADRPYKQYYKNYNDFNKVKLNLRIAGKFPNIITPDCYDLRSQSMIEFGAFAKYRYSNTKICDSIFNTYPDSSIKEFIKVAARKKMDVPSWFHNWKSGKTKDITVKKLPFYYVLRNRERKEIYSLTAR